ncbi:MAG: FlgD immunoglobulin-like domain containing protein [Candidatus Fermentibacteraceae bacterium]
MTDTRCESMLLRPSTIPFLLLAMVSLFAVTAAAEMPHPHDVEVPAPDEVGPDVLLEAPGVPLEPPDNPQVGDSWVWWLWVHEPMPPHFEQHVCTVRGLSDRGYVVVRDEEWGVSIDQADVDSILEYWENASIGPFPEQGIYETDSIAFGQPPDELDDDKRIYLLWFDFGISADGFFFWFDQYPEGTYPQYHSNECEVLYLNTTSQGGPGGHYMNAVMAHELEHMIHWKYDEDELSWVDEGMAELAMWLYGNPDNISGFNGNPDNSLVVWDGTWADYIKTYLWTLYFYERYGGLETVYAVVHEPANSTAGYDEILDDYGYSEDFRDVFADWTVANFLDDTTIADGRYGYAGDELPAFSVSGNYTSYPVEEESGTVSNWAADYYRFHNISDGGLTLAFDGSDTNWFAVWALHIPAAGDTEVYRMELDSASQSGEITVTGVEGPDDEVILVAASASSTGGPDYTFSAWESTGVSGGSSRPGTLSVSAEPNPATAWVTLYVRWESTADKVPSVSVYDASGRLARGLEPGGDPAAGEAVITWDRSREGGGRAPAGVYYVRVELGDERESEALLLLP